MLLGAFVDIMLKHVLAWNMLEHVLILTVSRLCMTAPTLMHGQAALLPMWRPSSAPPPLTSTTVCTELLTESLLVKGSTLSHQLFLSKFQALLHHLVLILVYVQDPGTCHKSKVPRIMAVLSDLDLAWLMIPSTPDRHPVLHADNVGLSGMSILFKVSALS